MSDSGVWIHRCAGLNPSAWVCVGAGYAREDVKALILSQNKGFIAEAVTTLEEIAVRILKIKKEQILPSSSRQEILRMLLAEPRISAQMPEIKRIKRQRNFLRRLDLAIQSGRMTFAHLEEEQVYHERLKVAVGENLLRSEISALSRAYESWMEASSFFDLPLMIRLATEVLREKGAPTFPQEIFVLTSQAPESLEKEFWDVLRQSISVQFIGENPVPQADLEQKWSWEKWHTLDDAAESLADRLVGESNWSEHAVLIPDVPAIRRTLRRAFSLRNLPLADPRDPTLLRWDEKMKWALLPIEVVARNFERNLVISLCRSWNLGINSDQNLSLWVSEMSSRGIRKGIHHYNGGNLEPVFGALQLLKKAFGGSLKEKKTLTELAEAHLGFLQTFHAESSLIGFFQHSWKSFIGDVERVGLGTKKAPLLFWLERLQTRLSEASPPVEILKPKRGICLYRLQQSPVQTAKKVWIFGLPPNWFMGEGTGNYWFSEREREILSGEFQVRSAIQVRMERVQSLNRWVQNAQEIILLDAHFSAEGRERESLIAVLKEWEMGLGLPLPDSPEEKGAYPLLLNSYGTHRISQPQQVKLPHLPRPAGKGNPELSATLIDRYSRCSMQALAYHRWNLRDLRDPDSELWPEVRGNILHEAVRLLLQKFSLEAGFTLTPRQALELAWKFKPPRGLLKGKRIENYVKSRLLLALESFCEKEFQYLQRSGADIYSLDQIQFRIDYDEFSLIGQPDRVDLHPDGIFIMDYKTSGTVPSGTEILERSYRLQLPFYAVAAQKKLDRPVLGVQFIELSRKGSRNAGIFFKPWNGKEEGSLTQVRSTSKSLMDQDPNEVWRDLEEKIVLAAKGYLDGKFQAHPRSFLKETECRQCRVADLCGLRRQVDDTGVLT